jgi:hypothetical protein
MKKISNVNSNGDIFSQELRAQPRKSNVNRKANVSYNHDAESPRHTHRDEPSKNFIRVQLRRIQKLF